MTNLERAERHAKNIKELMDNYNLAVKAIKEIKENQGKVCSQFEICDHESCKSSVAAWMIADKALRSLTITKVGLKDMKRKDVDKQIGITIGNISDAFADFAVLSPICSHRAKPKSPFRCTHLGNEPGACGWSFCPLK